MIARYFLSLAALFSLCFFSEKMTAQVVVNEYSASNLSQFVDDHSDYGDWFELYNAGPDAVDLSGFWLSDDDKNVMQWQIPTGISIASHGVLRFWASGRDQKTGELHTNFTLKQTKNKKDHLILADPTGVVLDDQKLSRLTKLGHSWGRLPDGGADWVIFTSPTPKLLNVGTTFTRYTKKPNASVAAGFYDAPFYVKLTSDDSTAVIHFTTDGKEPLYNSPVYSDSILIDKTTVLKAIAISPDPTVFSSFIDFETYFIGVSHTFPVVSIAGTNLDVLANGDKNQLPFGSLEYFNLEKKRSAKSYGEFNSHGQDSWANSQRSLDFVSRDECGYSDAIKEKMFEMTDRKEFQRVILRAAGDDNYPADHHQANEGSAHIRDAYVQNLSKRGGLHLDVREASKCIIYLNGEYWGIYDLRERPDDHDYTKYNYGQDKYHLQYIQTWGNTWAQYGGPQALTDWKTFRTYIYNHSMTDSVAWKYVTDRLDVTSLADYVIINGHTVCSDWLNYNTGWWRGLDSTGTHQKWGYTLWDNDAVFAFYINYTGIPDTSATASPCDPETISSVGSDPERHIKVLNKLLTNPSFKTWYINRKIDLMNTVFSCDNMLHQLDSIITLLTPEMPMHAARWGGTMDEWQKNAARLRDFIVRRCANLPIGLQDCYQLAGPYDVTIERDGNGTVDLNSIHIDQFPWTGKLFGNVETSLVAHADSAYFFSGWTAQNQAFLPNSTTESVKFDMFSTDTIVVHFTPTVATEEPSSLKSEPKIAAWPTVFSNQTTLKLELPEAAPVSIRLVSMLGQPVSTVWNDSKNWAAGSYSMDVNLEKMGLPSGVYFLETTAGSWHKTVKLVFQK